MKKPLHSPKSPNFGVFFSVNKQKNYPPIPAMLILSQWQYRLKMRSETDFCLRRNHFG